MMKNRSRSDSWNYRKILEKKPTKVFLGLGSNLGEREKNLTRALELLEDSGNNQILKVSSIFETEPVDCPGGLWFLNQAAFLVTLLPVYSFMFHLQRIEALLGRANRRLRQPRPIDLDILFFGDLVVVEEDLQIPHPRLHLRRFILEPLCELNPQLWHPVFNKTLQELLEEAPRTHEVRRFVPAAR